MGDDLLYRLSHLLPIIAATPVSKHRKGKKGMKKGQSAGARKQARASRKTNRR